MFPRPRRHDQDNREYYRVEDGWRGRCAEYAGHERFVFCGYRYDSVAGIFGHHRRYEHAGCQSGDAGRQTATDGSMGCQHGRGYKEREDKKKRGPKRFIGQPEDYAAGKIVVYRDHHNTQKEYRRVGDMPRPDGRDCEEEIWEFP